MGLAAADLHDRPRTADRLLELLERRANARAVPELVHVLHGASSEGAPSSADRRPAPRRNSSDRCASASSMRPIAKPTWMSVYSPTAASGTYARHASFTTPPKSIRPIGS